MSEFIDYSSDAITTPTDAMWEAMRAAELGWAPRGLDPSVNTLEEMAAAVTGKEAALLVVTGTQCNLLALLSHTNRGDQVVLGDEALILLSEERALAAIAGLLPRPVAGEKGVLDPSAVEEAITSTHYTRVAPTGVFCLENTHDGAGGTVTTVERTHALCDVAHRHNVPVHLDGCRVFNAAAALGVDVKTLVEPVDSVMFSLCKGLSAPMGAMLCGSLRFVEKARQNRKVLGANSLHKWGIAAAAGIVALSTMAGRLGEDHRRARMLADSLVKVKGLRVDLQRVQTNMVQVNVANSGWTGEAFLAELGKHRVRAILRDVSTIRLVTHRNIDDEDVTATVKAFEQVAGAKN